MNRNLDGVYFRVKRDDKWMNICFTDLTNAEREEVCKDRSKEWFESLCYYLADTIKVIGEEFDIMGGDIE